MDNPVFIIEMPELSDEAVVCIRDFLQDLIIAFESQYFGQLRRHYQKNNEVDLF